MTPALIIPCRYSELPPAHYWLLRKNDPLPDNGTVYEVTRPHTKTVERWWVKPEQPRKEKENEQPDEI